MIRDALYGYDIDALIAIARRQRTVQKMWLGANTTLLLVHVWLWMFQQWCMQVRVKFTQTPPTILFLRGCNNALESI
jgi:hypothetical protein